MEDLGRRARAASRLLARAASGRKNAALQATATRLQAAAGALIDANRLDLESARAAGQDSAFVDRLALDRKAIDRMALGLEQIVGIRVVRMRVPLGVVGMTYESRPNVTIDAAGLCIKSGNASILRGGSEAIHSNRALAGIIREGLEEAGLPAVAVQLVGTT